MLPLALLRWRWSRGSITGHASGASLKFAISSEHVLAYLLLLPVAVANLDLDAQDVTRLLGGLMGIAIFKAVLGLIEVAGHLGAQIEGTSTLTYYEPTANWLIMIVAARASSRRCSPAQRLPRWVLLGSPLLLACLMLSYRRSFWIGAVLGLLLVVVLGTLAGSAAGCSCPPAWRWSAAILLLGSIHFQSQLPLAKRADLARPRQASKRTARTATGWTSAPTCWPRSKNTRSPASGSRSPGARRRRPLPIEGTKAKRASTFTSRRCGSG